MAEKDDLDFQEKTNKFNSIQYLYTHFFVNLQFIIMLVQIVRFYTSDKIFYHRDCHGWRRW